jgi:hypothetical protein
MRFGVKRQEDMSRMWNVFMNEDHEVYVISWKGKFYLATVVRLSISSSFSICVMANRTRLTVL